ncbi:hypothetical protein ACE6H2_008879 [Prunus campanulata]
MLEAMLFLKVTWQKFSNRHTVGSHMSQSPLRKPHVLMVCPVTGLSRSRENPYTIVCYTVFALCSWSSSFYLYCFIP